MTEKTAAELALELKTSFNTRHDEVKAIAEKAVAEAARGVEMSTTQKELADQALAGMNEAKARLDELEQKMVRGGGLDTEFVSAGEAFVNSAEFKGLNGTIETGEKLRVELKDITSLTTNAAGSVGSLVRAERVPGMLTMIPNRELHVRDLIAPGTTAAPSIEYYQETGFTNAADFVAEGALKPESSIQMDLKTAPVRKIAHWMRATDEILADAPGLQSMIDGRLRYGVAFKEDVQLLNGAGGAGLTGINAVASAYAKPAGASVTAETAIDRIRIGMLQVELAEYSSTGHVLNPVDWFNIEVVKDAANGYIWANPAALTGPTLWGLPVVKTQAQPVGKFTTGAWRLAAQVFDRKGVAVTISTEDRDNFVTNRVTILAEERLALAIYRPQAFVFGNVNPA